MSSTGHETPTFPGHTRSHRTAKLLCHPTTRVVSTTQPGNQPLKLQIPVEALRALVGLQRECQPQDAKLPHRHWYSVHVKSLNTQFR